MLYASHWNNLYAPLGRNGSFLHKFGFFHLFEYYFQQQYYQKDFQKEGGRTQLFKLNLGIEKDNNGDFSTQKLLAVRVGAHYRGVLKPKNHSKSAYKPKNRTLLPSKPQTVKLQLYFNE